MCGSMADIQSVTAEIRRGKKKERQKKERQTKERQKKERQKKERKKKPQKYNGVTYSIGRP